MTQHHNLLQPPFPYFDNTTDDTENQVHGFYTPQPSSVPMGEYFVAGSRPRSAGSQTFSISTLETPKPRQTRQKPQLMVQTTETPFLPRLDSSFMPPTPSFSAGSSISSGSFSSRSLDSPAIATPADVEHNPFEGFKMMDEDDVFAIDLLQQGGYNASPACSPGVFLHNE